MTPWAAGVKYHVPAPESRAAASGTRTAMTKLLNVMSFPLIVVSGIVGKKIATALWQRVTGEMPPDTAQEHVGWLQLLPAAVVEGTLWQLSRMVLDRSLRRSVAVATGVWPGEAGEGE